MFIIPSGNYDFVFGTAEVADSQVDASSYTFSGMNIGAAATDRDILLFARSYGLGGGDHDLTGCTIGGVTATLVGQLQQFNRHAWSIHVARVPTGTTADVVMTFDEEASSLAVVTLPVRGVGTFGGFSFTRTDTLGAPYTLTLAAQGVADPFRLLACEYFLTTAREATTVTNMTQISNITSIASGGGGGTTFVTGFQEPSTLQPYFSTDNVITTTHHGFITLLP